MARRGLEGGRCGMGCQRLRVTDVDQSGEQIQRIEEACACGSALSQCTFHAKCQQAESLSSQVFLSQSVLLTML